MGALSFKTLVLRTRSYRRFDPARRVRPSELRRLVNLARLAGSGANRQPLKYLPICDAPSRARIFPCLAWAGYLTNWSGPADGERPTAYIVVLGDTTIRPEPGCDHGIAAQTIMLGATEMGLGGCMIGSINRERLRSEFQIPDRYVILLVLALGKPSERVVLETARGGAIRYWRDARGGHHVPKRPLSEVLLSHKIVRSVRRTRTSR